MHGSVQKPNKRFKAARFAHSGPAKAGPLTKRYEPTMREITASLIGIILGAIVFAIICVVFDNPSKDHLIAASLLGAFMGLLAAPECSPESFRHPKLFQVSSGIGVGFSIGMYFNASPTYTLALCGIGAIIGLFANQVTKAVHVP